MSLTSISGFHLLHWARSQRKGSHSNPDWESSKKIFYETELQIFWFGENLHFTTTDLFGFWCPQHLKAARSRRSDEFNMLYNRKFSSCKFYLDITTYGSETPGPQSLSLSPRAPRPIPTLALLIIWNVCFDNQYFQWWTMLVLLVLWQIHKQKFLCVRLAWNHNLWR